MCGTKVHLITEQNVIQWTPCSCFSFFPLSWIKEEKIAGISPIDFIMVPLFLDEDN